MSFAVVYLIAATFIKVCFSEFATINQRCICGRCVRAHNHTDSAADAFHQCSKKILGGVHQWIIKLRQDRPRPQEGDHLQKVEDVSLKFDRSSICTDCTILHRDIKS